MALSLLQHLRDTHRRPLIQQLSSDMQRTQAEPLVDITLPLVLAHLVSLNHQRGTSLVVALLNTQAQDGLWKTLDLDRLLTQLSQLTQLDQRQTKHAIDRVAHSTLVELHALYEQASLGEDGLHELLMAQPTLLQGHAPDWVWHIADLDELSGQRAIVPADIEPLTVDSGIAELNAFMREATMEKPDVNPMHHDTPHAIVDLPAQRDAGPWAKALAPIIALLLLALLVGLDQQNQTEYQAGRLVAPQGNMQTPVTVAVAPTLQPASPAPVVVAQIPHPPQPMPEPSTSETAPPAATPPAEGNTAAATF
jgi:hypothetical protein